MCGIWVDKAEARIYHLLVTNRLIIFKHEEEIVSVILKSNQIINETCYSKKHGEICLSVAM